MISTPVKCLIIKALPNVISKWRTFSDGSSINSTTIKREVFYLVEDSINPRDINIDWENEFGSIVDEEIGKLVSSGKAVLVGKNQIPIIDGGIFWNN